MDINLSQNDYLDSQSKMTISYRTVVSKYTPCPTLFSQTPIVQSCLKAKENGLGDFSIWTLMRTDLKC